MDVFISYAGDDRPIVETLAHGLGRAGFQVWQDQRQLRGGQEFPAEIDRALRAAKCVLACLSPAAVSRDWVITEMKVGRERGCLLPAIIAPLEIVPSDVAALIGRLHQRDLTTWVEDRPGREDAWNALIGDVCRYVRGASGGVPPSPPRRPAEGREPRVVNTVTQINERGGRMRDMIGQQVIKGRSRD